MSWRRGWRRTPPPSLPLRRGPSQKISPEIFLSSRFFDSVAPTTFNTVAPRLMSSNQFSRNGMFLKVTGWINSAHGALSYDGIPTSNVLFKSIYPFTYTFLIINIVSLILAKKGFDSINRGVSNHLRLLYWYCDEDLFLVLYPYSTKTRTPGRWLASEDAGRGGKGQEAQVLAFALLITWTRRPNPQIWTLTSAVGLLTETRA